MYVRAIIPETLPKVRSLKPGSRILHLRLRVYKLAAIFVFFQSFTLKDANPKAQATKQSPVKTGKSELS